VTIASRRYDSQLRREQAERTRAAILAAFAEQLGRPGAAELSIREAAVRAGVGVRTVYHYFPDRQSQLRALAGWIEQRLMPETYTPETPEDLLELARRLYASFRRNETLVRAQAVAGFAREVRTLRRRGRIAQIRSVLATIAAPEEMTNRATMIIAHLASSETGMPLLDVHGLSHEETERAVLQTIEALIADLRRHADAAQRA
jgi:AcrR family transcriptional regulator